MEGRTFPLLMETDQQRCYDDGGAPLDCAETGQDGALAKLPAAAASRFQDHGDTVADTLTGAVWSRDANPAGFPLTWEEARSYAADMARHKAYGYDNWQLPPRRVLFSLLSHQNTGPALPAGHPFSNVFQGYYWTDDSSSRFPSQAWHVHLGGGRIPRAGKADSFLVWPVSLPETKKTPATQSGEQRFSIRDGGILDSLTGLVWSRNADIATGPMTWKQGLAAVAELNRQSPEGIRDWRMPNIRELESLISLKDHSPALPPEHPFTQIRDAYWSSTTSVYEPTYAWTLYTRDGMVGVGFKTTPGFYLWPVRGKAFFTVVPYPL